ncbi:flagellar filament capping protein FliD [Leifsonia sp. A12D58]|uniref:flagellar filament capping protein FliD n=1 Tax=Leifsonia sp. A12D58 TaxID=3397674 RepID=UPI0039E1A9AB
MASNLAIDGLVSGLKTTELINSMMAVEGIPQTLLKAKVGATQAYSTALQALNTKIASLDTLAKAAAKSTSFSVFTATSSSSSVTTAVGKNAQAGQIDFTVGQLAQTQRSLTAAMSAWPTDPPVLTIAGSDGTSKEITAASTSLDDVVKAINSAGAGVTATKVSVGNGEFRLQLEGSTTGLAGSFSIFEGSGTTTPLATTTIKAAQDAEITLWAGTTAEQKITSKTNTFADVLPGVSVTVSAVSTTPVALSVARDDAAITTMAKDLVAALNEIFALVKSSSKVTTTTDAAGKTTTTAGVLAGDSTVRNATQRLTTAASSPIDGKSPSEYGISITKTGAFEFDAEKFAATLTADPAAMQTALQEIASRVSSVSTELSDKYDGTLTTKIASQESQVKTLGSQVTEWDRRLTSRRLTLEKVYSALEVQLGTLNTQSSWLDAQLSSLSNSK